jgi:Rrf2 family iron-sulfur cluster assembly transcriptional regulator
MRLTTKSRYAVTAMLGLALHKNKGPLTLAELSEKQGISLSYLEQLFASLREQDLVRGVRGPGGGYYLGRSAEEISIADIICATDEWVDYTFKNKPQSLPNDGIATSRGLWNHLSRQLFDYIDDIKLSDMIKDNADDTSGQEEGKIAA